MTISGLFVTGTDTGVGKTVVTAALCHILNRLGWSYGVMKPIETGWDGTTGEWPPDAGLLAEISGYAGDREDVLPVFFDQPAAPLMAARWAGQTVDIDRLDRAWDRQRRRHDFVLVEGAGGLAVPITEDLDMAGLARRWGLPLVVVARAALGTLNHTVLTVAYARAKGIPVAGIVVNQFEPDPADPTRPDNAGMIEELTQVPVWAVLPHFRDPVVPAVGEALAASPGFRRWLTGLLQESRKG
ncbi:MAG: dethiobiotin synthase [Sulfobacillus sp.]|nr:dethiobiotin synthase [Sulfobacillus sp.]